MNDKELINQVCEILALQVEQPAPKCKRITRRQGHSYWWKGTFSVPQWALKAHPAFRLYYIIHEACHCFAQTSGHTNHFFALETALLEQMGIRSVRKPREVYPLYLASRDGHKVFCNEYGQPVKI